MHMRLCIPLLILDALAGSLGAAEPNKVPDEKAVRAQIDERLQAYVRSGMPATIGVLHEVAGLSISFGAPVYNTGDHTACFKFYEKSMQDLVAAFSAEGKANASAAKLVHELDGALKRAQTLETVDDKAWALRFGWDLVALGYEASLRHSVGLVDLASRNFYMGRYVEAEIAARAALEDYKELLGSKPETVPERVGFANFVLANTLVVQGKYKEAAGALEAGCDAVPDWPTLPINQPDFFKEPSDHETYVKRIQEAVQTEPKEARLHFLLGHELFFSGHKELGQAEFLKALELQPVYPAAKLFRGMAADSPKQKLIAASIVDLGSEDFEKRQEATDKLKGYGKWAVMALKESASNAKDVEVRARVLALLKEILKGEQEDE